MNPYAAFAGQFAMLSRCLLPDKSAFLFKENKLTFGTFDHCIHLILSVFDLIGAKTKSGPLYFVPWVNSTDKLAWSVESKKWLQMAKLIPELGAGYIQ